MPAFHSPLQTAEEGVSTQTLIPRTICFLFFVFLFPVIFADERPRLYLADNRVLWVKSVLQLLLTKRTALALGSDSRFAASWPAAGQSHPCCWLMGQNSTSPSCPTLKLQGGKC